MISAYRARQLRKLIEQAVVSLPDEDAMDCATLFEAWAPGVYVEAGARMEYGGKLYRCKQSHTSQADWTPDATPALWTEVSVEEWPEWKQPTGAQDAYPLGAKVTHNTRRWISTVDNNTWEPGVYGWEAAS